MAKEAGDKRRNWSAQMLSRGQKLMKQDEPKAAEERFPLVYRKGLNKQSDSVHEPRHGANRSPVLFSGGRWVSG